MIFKIFVSPDSSTSCQSAMRGLKADDENGKSRRVEETPLPVVEWWTVVVVPLAQNLKCNAVLMGTRLHPMGYGPWCMMLLNVFFWRQNFFSNIKALSLHLELSYSTGNRPPQAFLAERGMTAHREAIHSRL
jgi:hypothetical protein